MYDESRNVVVVDAFELSADNEAVVAEPELIRQFPGVSVLIPVERFRNPAFLSFLASSLAQLASEEVLHMVPSRTRAGAKTEEHRASTHPGLVTECLMTQLLAFGKPNDDAPIIKRVHDDVLWNSTLLPWRRSAAWLVLRVALQTIARRQFARATAGVQGHIQYKNLLLFLMATLGVKVAAHLRPNGNATVDYLEIIRAKLGRRYYKLKDDVFLFVDQQVKSVADNLLASLLNIQSGIRKPERELRPIATTASEEDLQMQLRHSAPYLRDAMSCSPSETQVPSPPKFQKARVKFDSMGIPTLLSGSIIALTEFEKWVAEELQMWLSNIRPHERIECCKSAHDSILRYLSYAEERYESNPLNLSLMILTVLELWVAIDKLTVELHPLMKEFSPAIPPNFLEPLLLPLLTQMQRAGLVEEYVHARYAASDHRNPSMFDNPSPRSFAVQFFDRSQQHQDLAQEIEDLGKEEYNAKRVEWDTLNCRYRRALGNADAEPYHQCSYGARKNKFNCAKCGYMRQARGYTIQLYERPLPDNTSQRKSAVFEIGLPRCFALWRDVTWKILHDVTNRVTIPAEQLHQRLLNYWQYSNVTPAFSPRITLGSDVKSWATSHYRKKRFPVDFENIVVPNPFHFRLLDGKKSAWVDDQPGTPTVKGRCTLVLPTGPYVPLQHAVTSTSHTQNEILAQQYACSQKISLQAFVAFGSLRAGEGIQWFNILRELASSILSLNDPSVAILFKQAAWQFGSRCSESPKRVAHRAFDDPGFADNLIDTLERRLSGIEGNWNQLQTLDLLIMLGVRSLSLLGGSPPVGRFARFLRKCREVASHWCQQLNDDLHVCSEDEGQRRQRLILQIAGASQATYGVDADQIDLVLGDQKDLYFLVRSSMLLFENSPSNLRQPGLQVCLENAQRVRFLVRERVLALAMSEPSGIDEAIQNSLTFLRVSERWTSCNGSSEWLSSKARSDSTGREQTLHYNVLTGELLVNNKLPGRLPEIMRKDNVYACLFGARSLPVVPSNLPGSSYALTQKIHDFEVHIGIDQSRLVVKACKGSQVLRFVPRDVFLDDLPEKFVVGYYHWLDVETGVIEFRPADEPWKSRESNWRLSFDPNTPSKVYMRQGQMNLIDLNSHIHCQIADVLRGLDGAEHIVVIQTPARGIEVELSRFHLKFSIDVRGVLECKELGATVDDDQDIGCFYGLSDKLVLRDQKNQLQRSVLVPFGVPSALDSENHICVTIQRPAGSRVKYIQYFLDEHLQFLRGPPDLSASLYQAYLHALTTYPLPDPFTRRSGTQEAFRLLKQEMLKSSLPLPAECIEILQRISALSPRRMYYPKYLKVMQKVTWHGSLGQLAQHDDFHIVIKEILGFSNQFVKFHLSIEDESSVPYMGDEDLLSRARWMNARFRCSDFGDSSVALDLSPKESVLHRSRDCARSSRRSQRVYNVATLIRDWPLEMGPTADIVKTMEDYGSLDLSELPLGNLSVTEMMNISIGYWTSLYSFCRASSGRRIDNSFLLTNLFSLITFRDGIKEKLLRSLLHVAFSGACSLIYPPAFAGTTNVNLTESQSFVYHEVYDVICKYYAPSDPEETDRFAQRRSSQTHETRRKEYDHQRRQDIKMCCEKLKEQWPCEEPQLPYLPHFNQAKASEECKALFARWVRNRRTFEFLRSVEGRLAMFQAPDLRLRAIPEPRLHRDARIPPAFRGLSLLDLIFLSDPSREPRNPPQLKCSDAGSGLKFTPELQGLAESFVISSDERHREYGRRLLESIKALRTAFNYENGSTNNLSAPLQHLPVVALGNRASISYPTSFADICDLEVTIYAHMTDLQKERNEQWSRIVGVLKLTAKATTRGIDTVCPSLTVYSVLKLLACQQWESIPKQWKLVLVSFAKTISALRRCERLLAFSASRDFDGLFKEAANAGCEGWDPSKSPLWLLLEIENNITIRKRQVDVALQMINPDAHQNTVIQLNMGEGKTTVITPMVASILANGQDLLRIVLPKPLLRQSMGILSHRLGGLIGRRVYHIPFSRRTPVNFSLIKQLTDIYEDCLRRKGAFIALPEHILSFRLICLDFVRRQSKVSRSLIKLEHFLQQSCRNVIDEIDEVLDAKVQVVYTVGTQQPLDGQADRWDIPRHLLRLVANQAIRLQRECPNLIEAEQRDHRFPTLRFLSEDAFDKLAAYLLERIFQNEVPGIPFTQWPPEVRDSVKRFLQDQSMSEDDQSVLLKTFEGGSFLPKLLILRGLLACGILRAVLTKKRWRVDYGLHLSRCMMAVPYRAKDVPSESSEFGHPDVAITLTCLSYYYQGLNREQLRECFVLLARGNDPSSEYHTWVSGIHDLPGELRSLSNVNMENESTFEEHLYPRLRFRKDVVDFFLCRVVFPKEAREFPHKLSTSAWDLVSRPGCQITTGFSGTNDNQSLLPQTIYQSDLSTSLHTNAMVLSHLLQEENRLCVLAEDESGRQLNVHRLLHLVHSRCDSQVLIDVGAQILELENKAVAQVWLSITQKEGIEAAVFFNHDDEVMVIDRQGHIEPLQSSSFRYRMDACLVFLDQHHSRGVDLKLPPQTRAAVTLGPRLTKDRLVQGISQPSL